MHQDVKDYFNKNWYPIKEEWVLGLKSECGSFLKLKQVIYQHSSLEGFMEKFFVILNAL